MQAALMLADCAHAATPVPWRMDQLAPRELPVMRGRPGEQSIALRTLLGVIALVRGRRGGGAALGVAPARRARDPRRRTLAAAALATAAADAAGTARGPRRMPTAASTSAATAGEPARVGVELTLRRLRPPPRHVHRSPGRGHERLDGHARGRASTGRGQHARRCGDTAVVPVGAAAHRRNRLRRAGARARPPASGRASRTRSPDRGRRCHAVASAARRPRGIRRPADGMLGHDATLGDPPARTVARAPAGAAADLLPRARAYA